MCLSPEVAAGWVCRERRQGARVSLPCMGLRRALDSCRKGYSCPSPLTSAGFESQTLPSCITETNHTWAHGQGHTVVGQGIVSTLVGQK